MSSHVRERAPVVAAFSPETAAREPVEFGVAASRVTGAPLVVVAVRLGGPLVSRLAGELDDAGRTVANLRTELQRRGVVAEVKLVEARTVTGGLSKALEEIEPELVVLGSTRRGAAGSVLMGTTAGRVIHDSACPVAVVPNGYEPAAEGVRTIGAAFAPTAEGRDALLFAAALARSGGVRLRAIRVLDPEHAGEQSSGLLARQHRDTGPQDDESGRGRLAMEAEMRDAVAELGDGIDAELDVLVNDAADGLVGASQLVDLLVMGSRALGPKRAVVLGSVSRKVIERAACPVLILPRGASDMSAALLSDTKTHTSH